MNIELIKEKEQLLLNCSSILKKEFIGIDNVIDQVMNNIKAWYIYPELIMRPLVINLWGMTGCGKTSLVNRICELLEINNNKIYCNLAKLGEYTSSYIEDEFNSQLENRNGQPVFVFDEFQFAATLDTDCKEKEHITALKTIWEIIDHGKLYCDVPKRVKTNLETLIHTFDIVKNLHPKIKKHIWTNSKTCLEKMSFDQKYEILSLFNISHDIPDEFLDMIPNTYWCERAYTSIINDKKHFLTCTAIGYIFDAFKAFDETGMSYSNFKKDVLSKMNMEEVYVFVKKFIKKLDNGVYRDYSRSLVFIMGNIDEAYKISYNINPDMDPDQFRKNTEKLTIIDVKAALQARFRNEQIARLGNIMILYPSFSKKDFEGIIKLQLENYSNMVKEKTGIILSIDKSINDVIYKDGVFPTQGTRPIFTSIYEIVQSKIAPIIIECVNKKFYDPSRIELYYKDECVCACVYNGNAHFYTQFPQVLRIEKLRMPVKSEQQQITAVHESGHFVMYSKLTGKLPAKLMSHTTSSEMNGFMMEDTTDVENYMTKSEYLDSIKIDLAGYIAELIVFGKENLTSGASEDLRNATNTASAMIREFGMDPDMGIGVSTYLDDARFTNAGMLIKNTDKSLTKINTKIRKILDYCYNDVLETLLSDVWRNMFVKSCEYLRVNPSMPKEKMKEIYESVPEKVRERFSKKPDMFANLLNNFIKNTNDKTF